MRTIHKFPVYSTGSFVITVPVEARPLSVAVQNEQPIMWFELDTRQEHAKRCFEVVGTGQPVPENAIYIGTYQLGWFVGHLYEVLK